MNKISGVIWITGFSAAGKTTIARKVVHLLKKRGFNTIHLDGDELREILGKNQQYDKSSRIQLGKVYMQLCSHLAEQGYIVVISAIAMFDEVNTWLINNVENYTQIYLDVGPSIRKLRDAKTKKIFTNINYDESIYDIPSNPDLSLKNLKMNEIESYEEMIINNFLAKTKKSNLNRTNHWDYYYKKDLAPSKPSSFALNALDHLKFGDSIVEVGTGNGRDASFFALNGINIIAIDKSSAAIDLCKNIHNNLDIDFRRGSLPEIFSDNSQNNFDAVYMRFVLHAMTLSEEIATLEKCHSIIRVGGKLLIECRSIHDPLAKKGKIIGENERIDGHYRRFIVMEDLISRLSELGFKILTAFESNEVAALNNDNPVVIRLIAQK